MIRPARAPARSLPARAGSRECSAPCWAEGICAGQPCPAPLGHGFPGKGAGAGALSLRELLLAVGPAVLLCPCRDVALGALEVILDADPPPKGLSASLSVFQCCAGVPG